MRSNVRLFCIWFFLAATVHAQSRGTTDSGNNGVIHLGKIKKIDRKKNVILLSEPRGPSPGMARSGSRSGSGGRGGGRRGGGGGGMSGGPLPPNAAQVETKLTYSDSTLVKEDDRSISVDDLRIGDFVRVTERKQGKKGEAAEIERLPRGGL